MPQPTSADGPAGFTTDVASREELPEWPLAGAVVAPPVFDSAVFEPVGEGRDVAGCEADVSVPVPLPTAGTAAPGSAAWSALPLPGAGWPGASAVGVDPAAPPAAGAPGAGAAGGGPGTFGAAGGAGFADGVLDGGVLVGGAVGWGVLGWGSLGSLGSGLLCDGGREGVSSSEPPEGEGLGVVAEPSRPSSTSSRPRVSEPCADGADAAADSPMAACEAGTPAVPASTAPRATAAAPRRRPRWRPFFVVDTLDLKITMVIDPSRNRPAGKTCKNRGNPAGNPRDRRGSGCLGGR
jgi:hypothetical protein